MFEWKPSELINYCCCLLNIEKSRFVEIYGMKFRFSHKVYVIDNRYLFFVRCTLTLCFLTS